MDIGSELRRARLARRLSLDDITRTTKVSQSVLRALESNAFHDIPGGLFTRGYLRAYASSVGMDPDPIVAAYREAFDPPAPVVPEPDSDDAKSGHDEPHWSVEGADASSRHSEILQFGVILVVAVVYLASLRHPKTAPELASAEAATPAAAAVPAVAAPEPRAVGTSGTADASKPLTLDLRATGDCWVDVTADGTHVAGRLMTAGEHQTVTVRDDLTMRIGDPAAFVFSIDGAAARSLGEPGRAVTVHLTRANYRTLLANKTGS